MDILRYLNKLVVLLYCTMIPVGVHYYTKFNYRKAIANSQQKGHIPLDTSKNIKASTSRRSIKYKIIPLNPINRGKAPTATDTRLERKISAGQEKNKKQDADTIDLQVTKDSLEDVKVQDEIMAINENLSSVRKIQDETMEGLRTATDTRLEREIPARQEKNNKPDVETIDLQVTKDTIEDVEDEIKATTINLSSGHKAQGETMKDLRTSMESKHDTLGNDIQRNHEIISYVKDAINNLLNALDGQEPIVRVVDNYRKGIYTLMKTNFAWIPGSVLVAIVEVIIIIVWYRRKPKVDVERVNPVNPGTDYVIFTFTHNTERFLKLPQCPVMTQLKELPCFAESCVQEIYIPDNSDLGPLAASLENVKGGICVYEYNDKDIILESPTDLDTKKRDTVSMLKSCSWGMKLLVVYIFDPSSARMWDGEIYNSLIRQTYENDILSEMANNKQFLSIEKEFTELQLQHIQNILE